MFKTRLLSGILLVIIALLTIITGGDVLFGTILLISLIGMTEIYKVLGIEKKELGIVGYIAALAYFALIRFMERKRDHVVFPCVNLMLRNAKTVEDVTKARDYVLQEAETSYPEHMKAAMIEAIKKQFADPEALLKKLNKR